MKLLNLAARICNAFSRKHSQLMRTVRKVKDDQIRDVVTELDMELHHISDQFILECLPGCRMLSEEGIGAGKMLTNIREGEWLIVDPLDGSNNYALGLPHYGYMASHLTNGSFAGAVIILPEYNQYIVCEGDSVLYSQPLPAINLTAYGTVYYAYPPRQAAPERQARAEFLSLIDNRTAGMYRYGSACVGLYHMLCGKHVAFIGHGIRVWDALAFLPVLTANKFTILYQTDGEAITLLAGKQTDFLERAEQILRKEQGLLMHSFSGHKLKVDA